MFAFDNTYARDLEGLYAEVTPRVPKMPRLVVLNVGLAEQLGLGVETLKEHGAQWLSGAAVPPGATPIAQAYAGHQFGGLNPQLGDGRAVLLGELVDRDGHRVDLQLKGSGRTPFSRGGDGKAALGPMLREYLLGEAMHGLGIPTTRALAVTTTGEPVYRESPLPGAVLARIASSHLRVGTFEFFALREDTERLQRLLHYTLRRHHPHLVDHDPPALALLEAVRDAQAHLVARWMAVGFIHGVMNTDNVALSGETIDYGPCAFMDAHDPSTVFSSIDHGGRYAYGNQPGIMAWNLSRFATALLPLVHEDRAQAVPAAQAVLDGYADAYRDAWHAAMRPKLGLTGTPRPDDDDALIRGLLSVMEEAGADHTLTFRHLATHLRGEPAPAQAILGASPEAAAWLDRWQARLQGEDDDRSAAARADAMDRVNPLYIPRNHKVEEALDAAGEGDLQPLHTLLDLFEDPFTSQPGHEAWAEPAPTRFTACYQTFCGT